MPDNLQQPAPLPDSAAVDPARERRQFQSRLKTYLQGVGIGVLLVIALMILRQQMLPPPPGQGNQPPPSGGPAPAGSPVPPISAPVTSPR